jgi:hypothetical protein
MRESLNEKAGKKTKKKYIPPRLEPYGKVTELTMGGGAPYYPTGSMCIPDIPCMPDISCRPDFPCIPDFPCRPDISCWPDLF